MLPLTARASVLLICATFMLPRAFAAERQTYSLPAGDAAVALRQLSEAAHREILFPAEAVRGVQTNAVQGEFTMLEAANRMLEGTSLYALQEQRSGALAVRKRETASATPRTGPMAAPPSRPATAAASTGNSTLRGRVSNATTGQSLEGAVVHAIEAGISVRTDREGAFMLERLPAGLVPVKVTYPGLDDITVGVELPPGAAATRDFSLTSDLYKMEAYAVTAVREGTAAAIARQEAALTVGNTVAIDAFGNVAKGDLGTFLQRLPGVVGEYGGSAVDAISVRGLSPEFTTVNMDGTRAAMANPDSRTQMVSAMPAGAVESVEVIKTPTADMDADSLGGVVNLRTRSGFDRTGRAVILNASTTYNDTLGKYVDAANGRYLFPSYSVEYSDVFMLLGRKLGVSVTGTYQDIGDGLQTVRAEFAPRWDYVSPSAPRRVVYADHEFHLNKRADLHTKFDYKLSSDSSLSFSAGITRHRNFMDQIRPQYVDNLTIDAARSTEDYWVFSRVRYRSAHVLRYIPNEMLRFRLAGRHRLSGINLEWDLSYSDSNRPYLFLQASARSANDFSMVWDRRTSKEFPTMVYTGGIPPPSDPFTNINLFTADATHEVSTDKVKSAKLDATRDFTPWGLAVKLKTGFRVRQEDRTRDYDQIAATMPAGNYSQYRQFHYTHGWIDGRYPATPVFDTNQYFLDAAVGYKPDGTPTRPAVPFTYNPTVFAANLDTSATNSLLNDYRTRETIPAGYVQATIKIAKPLQVTAGVRYEQTRTSITSRKENAGASTPEARYADFKTVESDYATWFPNLQLRYEPIRHLTFRANYSTTIGRPRISDLVGRFSVNETGQSLSFSNPSLKPQESRNYDASVEYYFEPVGVLSAGVFRKEIKNYVTSLTTRLTGNEFGLDLSEYAGWNGTTRVNAGDGTVEGAEFNYTQQLSFLPGVLRGLGATANWTVITSAGDYNGLIANLPFKNYLTGLRPHSGNAGLTYVYGRWDVRVMWNYADDYIISLDTSDPSNSEFMGARQQWDLFGRFKVTRALSVFMDVINLGESHRGRYRGLVREDRRGQTNLFPRTITVGAQLRF